MTVNSVCGWVNRCLLDTADSDCSFNSGNLDVSLISPWGSPGVSNNVVVLSGSWISSITNSSDSVIKLSSTSSRVQNTWSILLENSSVSFNSDWNWLFCNCSHKLWGRFRWNSCVPLSLNNTSVFTCLARLSGGCVGVVSLEILSMKSCISESTWLPTSIASLTGHYTINKLLFSERKEFSSLNKVFSFNGSSGWESPAWSTLSLIFNWINSSFSSPVNCISEIWIIKICWLLFLERCWHFESVHFFCFKFCHCWEHVVSNFEWILACIDFIDFSIFLLIKLESEFILFLSSNSNSELLNMLNKVLFKKRKFFFSFLTFVVFNSNECSGFAK